MRQSLYRILSRIAPSWSPGVGIRDSWEKITLRNKETNLLSQALAVVYLSRNLQIMDLEIYKQELQIVLDICFKILFFLLFPQDNFNVILFQCTS